MADAEERGVVGPADFLDEVHRDRGVLGIEARGGFVGEDEFGLAGEGAGDGDALLLPDAEVLGEGSWVGDAEFCEEGARAVVVFGGGDAGEREGEENILERGEAVEEVEGLEDDADVFSAEVVSCGTGDFVDVSAGDAEGAGCGLEQPEDEIEECGFPGAGLSGEEDLLGVFAGEFGDVEQRVGLVGVPEVDPVKTERGPGGLGLLIGGGHVVL